MKIEHEIEEEKGKGKEDEGLKTPYRHMSSNNFDLFIMDDRETNQSPIDENTKFKIVHDPYNRTRNKNIQKLYPLTIRDLESLYYDLKKILKK